MGVVQGFSDLGLRLSRRPVVTEHPHAQLDHACDASDGVVGHHPICPSHSFRVDFIDPVGLETSDVGRIRQTLGDSMRRGLGVLYDAVIPGINGSVLRCGLADNRGDVVLSSNREYEVSALWKENDVILANGTFDVDLMQRKPDNQKSVVD